MVLEDAAERVFAGDRYGDIAIKGWYIVRAENVVVLGEIDPAREREVCVLCCCVVVCSERSSVSRTYQHLAKLKRVDADVAVKLRTVHRQKEEEKRKLMLDYLDDADDGF